MSYKPVVVEKIYVDTNVYLDYFSGRKDKLRPLGHFAFELFRKILNGDYKVIISDFLIEELEKFVDSTKLSALIKDFKDTDSVIFIESDQNDFNKAKRYSNKADALHAILAIKANADYFITRNIKDFESFSDKIKIVFPERL